MSLQRVSDEALCQGIGGLQSFFEAGLDEAVCAEFCCANDSLEVSDQITPAIVASVATSPRRSFVPGMLLVQPLRRISPLNVQTFVDSCHQKRKRRQAAIVEYTLGMARGWESKSVEDQI